MEVQGRITKIFETKEYGSNGFRKSQMVVTTEEQYPQPLLIEFVQDKSELPHQYKVGQLVIVGVNLRGREWTSPQGETKYFVSLNGWRVQNVEAQQPQTGATPPPEDFEPINVPDFGSDDEEDDLPF